MKNYLRLPVILPGHPAKFFSMFMNADLVLPDVADGKGERHPLSLGSYQRYIKSNDPILRKNAFDSLHQKMKDHTNTLTSIYLSSLKKDVFEMRARNYTSSCEASLSSKNIDVAVYDNLIQTVHEHLPLLHRYVRLRKKCFSCRRSICMIYIHLLYMIWTKPLNTTKQKKSFSKSKPLGADYLALVKKDLKNVGLMYMKTKESVAAHILGVHTIVILICF